MELSYNATLDAVNEILSVVGEAPINTLENLQNIDAINALRLLDNVSRKIQAKGWSFNTIPEYTLNPDAQTKRIRWTDNFLYLRGLGGENLVKYGEYLKDLAADKTEFDGPLVVEAVLLLDLGEMPVPMRSYIVTATAHAFAVRFFGSPDLVGATSEDVSDALITLNEFEIDRGRYNALNNQSINALRKR